MRGERIGRYVECVPTWALWLWVAAWLVVLWAGSAVALVAVCR